MRLYIREFTVEELCNSFNGDGLGNIHVVTTGIVATSGITLGIFVCKDRTSRLENSTGNNIF